MIRTLQEELASGHMVLTEQGEWTRDNPQVATLHLDDLTSADALACGLANVTEKGRQVWAEELARLKRELGIK